MSQVIIHTGLQRAKLGKPIHRWPEGVRPLSVLCSRSAPLPTSMSSPFKLNLISGCQDFVDSQTPSAIAAQILRDQLLCQEGGVPSLIVYCLPQRTDSIARAISDSAIPVAVARMRFASIVKSIKSYLANLPQSSSPGDNIPAHMIPTDADYSATLKVLSYLQLPQVDICPDPSVSLHSVFETVKAQLSLGADLREAINQQHIRSTRRCYMCRYIITSSHPFYASLCIPCGDFNVTSSSLSLPANLQLYGKTALVTGGRINLGFHTALRLLRCGACVIVSTRYPIDAETRYLNQEGSDRWKSRLKIVGADFRAAKDVFSLVNAVVDCIKEWSADSNPRLHILINNAAQTLTDSKEKETESIQRELRLKDDSPQKLLLDANYTPRVGGGLIGSYIELPVQQPPSSNSLEKTEKDINSIILPTQNEVGSSWVQHIADIPYEDVISAHSVNTFVPFILVRELLPHMSDTLSKEHGEGDSGNQKAAAYIVNVSSREGIFETTPGHANKNGHHVHTNMSKAALNMLTETEAGAAWKNGRVAMNTVDPGYMSGDPVYLEKIGRAGTPCPIGWEDGAGRVLWPVAKGEAGQIIRGRFLKHFSEINTFR